MPIGKSPPTCSKTNDKTMWLCPVCIQASFDPNHACLKCTTPIPYKWDEQKKKWMPVKKETNATPRPA